MVYIHLHVVHSCDQSAPDHSCWLCMGSSPYKCAVCLCSCRRLKRRHIWRRSRWDGDREGHRHVFTVRASPGALFWQGKRVCANVFLGSNQQLNQSTNEAEHCLSKLVNVTFLCFHMSWFVWPSFYPSDHVTSAFMCHHLFLGSHWVHSRQESGGTEQTGKVTHYIITCCGHCGCMCAVFVPGGCVLLFSRRIDLEA